MNQRIEFGYSILTVSFFFFPFSPLLWFKVRCYWIIFLIRIRRLWSKRKYKTEDVWNKWRETKVNYSWVKCQLTPCWWSMVSLIFSEQKTPDSCFRGTRLYYSQGNSSGQRICIFLSLVPWAPIPNGWYQKRPVIPAHAISCVIRKEFQF